MKGVGSMITMVFLLGIVIVFIGYTTVAMGVLDSEANVSADYEPAYNTTRDTSILGLKFVQIAPTMIGVAILLGAVLLMKVVL